MEGIYYELNPYTMCRTCLGQQMGMLDLVLASERQKNLLEMLIIITGFQVQLGGNLPFYVCELCEGKIEAGFYFREQCKKNNDLMLQYICTEPSKSYESEESKISIVDETEAILAANEGCEENDSNSIINDPDLEDTLNEEEEEDEEEEIEEDNDKEVSANRSKQSIRLQQFSYDEVSRAIEEAKQPFFEKIECFKCGFLSANARALSLHMSHIHKDLKGKWCSKCNQEFENLSEHNKEHENTPLCCKFCQQIFTTKAHLTQHLQSHSDVRPFKCDICLKTFLFSRYLKVHQRIHSNECPYKCDHCDKSFVQYNSLRCHIKRHEAERTACAKCRQTFDDPEGYINHVCDGPQGTKSATITTSIPQNYCDICDKKVRSLRNHKRQVHGGEGAAAGDSGAAKLCMECGKQFKTNSKLKIHMRVHTGEAPYKCSFCDKRVSTRNHLVLHERTHTGEKPHVCRVCGKGFAQSSVLNTHMRLHTGRPEVCMICNKRFCRPTELKLHMRKHTGEKPFLCMECGQSFVQRSHLMEHIKTHSEERPFKCHFCGRGFKQNSSLKTHVQIHLGHKPYRCTHCSYACRQSYSLTQHMKQHLDDVPRPERPHNCPVCNRAFTTMAVMNSHMSTAHNVWYGPTNVESVDDGMYSKQIDVVNGV